MSVLLDSDRDPDPLQALELRRWALACLASARGRAPAAPAGISPATWSLFLATERCAVSLARRRDHGAWSPPAPVEERLAASAGAELRRILAARAQLQTLTTLAAETGCRPILMRGGACLNLDDRSCDLDDLDLLLPPADAKRFAHALDAAGYRPHVGSGSYRHLDARMAPGALAVEIHVSPDPERAWPRGSALADAQPIPDLPGLARLPPTEHAWSILAHVTVDHLDRRGRIRDLLLLADALADCSPDERATLARRAAIHPAGHVMDAQLAMARAIGDGKQPVDAFEGIALTNYIVRRRTGGVMRLPGNLPVTASNLLFAVLGGPTERRYFWARETSIPLEPSRFAFIAWVQRRYPTLGSLWLLFFRLLRLPVALALVVPLALAARRALRRAGLPPRIG